MINDLWAFPTNLKCYIFFKVQGVQGDNEQSAKSLNIYILIFIICADRKLSYINENDIYDA